MSAYTFESPIPIENEGQVGLIVTSTLCIFFTSLFVGLRVLARFKVSKPLDWSDLCILTSLFFNTAFHADVYIMVFAGGFGFHVEEVGMRFGPDALTIFFKCIMVFAILWNATTCFTKLSILFMFTSLFPVPKMLLACKILGAFIILWNIGGVLGAMLVCQPFAMNWDQSLAAVGGKCGNQPLYYLILGIINIIVEFIMLCLPFPIIWKLHMPLRKRIVVFAMFSVGFATCSVTIWRQTSLSSVNFADMTYSGLRATLLSSVEPSVALCLACVPFLRPFFGSLFRGGTKASYYVKDGDATGESGLSGNPLRTFGQGDSKGSRGGRPFEELTNCDDGDALHGDGDSEVQLRPMQKGGKMDIHISSTGRGSDSDDVEVDDDAARRHHQTSGNKTHEFITVKKQWEVKTLPGGRQ